MVFLTSIGILSSFCLIKILYDTKKEIDEEEAQFIDNSVAKRIKEKYKL